MEVVQPTEPPKKENPNQTNYGMLMEIHNSIQNQVAPIPALYYLMRSRIRDFYSTYGGRIQTTNDKIMAIETEYFKRGEDGNIEFGEDKKPILNDGKDMDSYQKEVDEIFGQPCIL